MRVVLYVHCGQTGRRRAKELRATCKSMPKSTAASGLSQRSTRAADLSVKASLLSALVVWV